MTPLDVAVRSGRSQVVELLLQMGADPSGHPNSSYYPPSQRAIVSKQKQTVEMLLHYGANPEPFMPISKLHGYGKLPFSTVQVAIESLLVAAKEKGVYYVAST